MTYQLIHGDARHVSDVLEPASVDLVVTSPPYFALRSYRDDGEHFPGQLGSEATPGEFIDALIECTEDWLKVLRPGGSIFVNLGDKRAGSGGHNNWHTATLDHDSKKAMLKRRSDVQNSGVVATRRNAPDRYNQNAQVQADRRGIGEKAMREDDGLRRIIPDGVRAKSLMLLPHRYAIRCIDELGLIVRADMVWHKPNGLPESVTDRVRQNHEYWFHLTREPRYFAAVDEIREPHAPKSLTHRGGGQAWGNSDNPDNNWGDPGVRFNNPLGTLPGSVWTIPSEPLTVPAELGVDHFAAFPSEWPRRLILGWSPSGWCTECGEARRPVVEKIPMIVEPSSRRIMAQATGGANRTATAGTMTQAPESRILGYACACPDTTAPTQPAVVLDPFCGTGTTVAVAHHLGRHGIGIDLSRDYLRLAEWRCTSDTRLRDKILDRAGLPQAPKIDGQLSLEDLL